MLSVPTQLSGGGFVQVFPAQGSALHFPAVTSHPNGQSSVYDPYSQPPSAGLQAPTAEYLRRVEPLSHASSGGVQVMSEHKEPIEEVLDGAPPALLVLDGAPPALL